MNNLESPSAESSKALKYTMTQIQLSEFSVALHMNSTLQTLNIKSYT